MCTSWYMHIGSCKSEFLRWRVIPYLYIRLDMRLQLLQNIWILPQLRQLQSFTRPLCHLIRSSPNLIHLPVINKLRIWLGNSTFTTELVLDHLFIYLLSTRANLSFAVHKLAKFSSNPGELNFEGLLHLLRYIGDNKTLGLKYYSDTKDAPVSDMLRKASILTENQLMAFPDSSW